MSRVVLWGGLAAMVGQWVLFARLTFWELSWYAHRVEGWKQDSFHATLQKQTNKQTKKNVETRLTESCAALQGCDGASE